MFIEGDTPQYIKDAVDKLTWRNNFGFVGDMNDCRYPGMFSGQNMQNSPTSGWFTWLNFTQNCNTAYVTQAGFSLNDSVLYVRTFAFGNWSAWRKI